MGFLGKTTRPVWGLLLGCIAVSCGGGTASVKPPPKAAVPAPPSPAAVQAEPRPEPPSDPGRALIASEKAVWMLEGLLVAEADKLLHKCDAKEELGEPEVLIRQNGAEARVRAYLRARRSDEVKRLAREFVSTLNEPSRELLASAAERTGIASEDLFMDYLTYEAVFDLAAMRLGYRRWKAGRFAGNPKSDALAASFFAESTQLPTAKLGIAVSRTTDSLIEIDVFGGRVREEIVRSESKQSGPFGRVGVVEWTSNYERLRRMIRGEAQEERHREELAPDGRAFRVGYVAEIDEYLTWNASSAWATMLYVLRADEVADLYAGAAANGGFEAGSSSAAADPARLARKGRIGTRKKGMDLEVVGAKSVDSLAGVKPRRGQFVLVQVKFRSRLSEALNVPAEWFTLATAEATFAEVGVSRPGLAPLIAAISPKGSRMLQLPYTAVAAKATEKLVLIYDVPADLRIASLVVGSDELALKVEVKAPKRSKVKGGDR